MIASTQEASDALSSVEESNKRIERVVGVAKLIGQVETMVEQSGNPEGFDAARWVAQWIERPNAALGGRPNSWIPWLARSSWGRCWRRCRAGPTYDFRHQLSSPMKTKSDAYHLLTQLGANQRLVRHAELVGEAADLLMQRYRVMGLAFDAQLVELGVALHDAGKVLHPAELDGPGSLHEPAGASLMIENGVPAKVARCCITHAAWRDEGVTLEERTVALADKLWKGKREAELELLVIDEVAKQLGLDRWDVFAELDSTFEDIAASASDRLDRSRV